MYKSLIGISAASMTGGIVAILMSNPDSAVAVEMPAACDMGAQHLKECCTISFSAPRSRNHDFLSDRFAEITACIDRMKAGGGKVGPGEARARKSLLRPVTRWGKRRLLMVLEKDATK